MTALAGVEGFAPMSSSSPRAFGVTTTKHMSSPTAAASSSAKAPSEPASSEGGGDTNLGGHFLAARDQLVQNIVAAVETPSMAHMLEHFTTEYFTAMQHSYEAGNTEYTPQESAARFSKALELGMKYGMGPDRYTFGVKHTALRGRDPDLEDGNTYDYYKFGCDFFRGAMDVDNSVVLGADNLKKAFAQVEAGENVVFFANHQSEADPQVFSCLLEKAGYGEEGAEVAYVAGHKVTTDTLAIPFSMGRNLLCIHSKKHIDADPEMKGVKQKQNMLAMSAMLGMMRKGGASLWVAPSGGRDRRNVDTGEIPIANFDQKVIDMFRLMGNKSKVPTHYYPLAMVSYDLCPPPDFVEAGVGEDRNVRFCPVGIACGDELENVGGVETRHKFTELAQEKTDEGYHAILAQLAENAAGAVEESSSEADEGDGATQGMKTGTVKW
eukprot:CAMPEP_0113525572 /NCGR_PEP_ID=MMETSP0015_2-20120614/240_1 /TAXON_ID=2838 /ORGANISM="Odontella" /LENGTH=437 /DNA_ID=CAMNT_0000423761 /DNA_START=329 /DNA_END=1642 /DNA_ORIENTATION=- /assembly_acc=CAM_ASM_000160